MTSPLNEIEIGVTVSDDTAAGFASIYARAQAFKAAMQGSGGGGTAGPDPGLGLGSWARQAVLLGGGGASSAGGVARDMRLVLAQLRQGGAAHQDLLLTIRQLNAELRRTPVGEGGAGMAGDAAAAAAIAAAVTAALGNIGTPGGSQPNPSAFAQAVATALGAQLGSRTGGGGGGGGGMGWLGGLLGGGFLGGITRFFGGGGGGGGKMPLFGGMPGWMPAMLATIGPLGLLVHGVIELAAVLIPATLGFLAFGAAAIPTAQRIYGQMQNVNIVTQALNKSVYPLTGQFSGLVAAARPYTLNLFGQALYAVSGQSKTLLGLIPQVGQVLQALGARAVAAARSGGFSQFLVGAAKDLSLFGTIIGNVMGAIGNLLRAVPGYAQTLLGLVNSGTQLLEWATKIAQPLIAVGLAAHGAFLYMGIGATLIGRLVSSGFGGLTNILMGAANWFGKFGTAGQAAARELTGFASIAAKASRLPWGWITGAALLLGFLIDKMVTAKNATQAWFAEQQKVLLQQPALRGVTTAMTDQAIVAARLATAQRFVAKADQDVAVALGAVGRGYGNVTGPTQLAQRATIDYGNALGTLIAQQQRFRNRIAEFTTVFGSQQKVYALIASAGLTYGDMVKKGASANATLLIELHAANDALTAMSIGTGRSAAAMNALNFSTGNTKNTLAGYLPMMQKVVQAEDTVTTVVLGSEQAFIGYQQALQGMRQPAAAAGSGVQSLGAKSLQTASVFWTQLLPAGQKLIDSLNLQAASTKRLTVAVADEAKSMLPFAQGNMAARAAIMSLINNALGPGTVNLQNLNTWVRQNSGSMQGFRNIIAEATVKAATLTGTVITMANNAFKQLIFQESGAKNALAVFTSNLLNNQNVTVGGISARAALIRDLEKTGLSAKQAQQYVKNLANTIAGLHGTSANIQVSGTGTWTVSQFQAPGAGKHVGTFARGGRVPGWGGGDMWPALLEGGEVVVPKHLAGAIAPFLRAHGVPGMAGGGVVGSYQGSVPGLGRWLTAQDNATLLAIERAVAQGVLASLRTPMFMAGGPGGGTPSANAAMFRRMFPQWSSGALWSAVNYVAMAESGWNNLAWNPSGAYGIPQALPFSKMPMAAWPPWAGGRADPGTQNAWFGAYMQGRYGGPMGAAAHEAAFHWYDKGGWLKPGLTMALNTTGRPEPVGWGTAGPISICIKLSLDKSLPPGLTAELLHAIRWEVIDKGGGSVQVALGSDY